MKPKFICLLLAVCLTGFSVACTDEGSAPSAYTVCKGGGVLTLGMSLREALECLGENDAEQQVAESCAGSGRDILVTVPSLRLYAYETDTAEAVLVGILLTDDGAFCNGVTIGMSRDEAISLLNLPHSEENNRLTYNRNNTELVLTLRDGKVTSVYLTAK